MRESPEDQNANGLHCAANGGVMSDRKKLSVVSVEVHGGWPRGRVILSDGSDLDGLLSLGFKQPVHPLVPPQVMIEVIVRGQFPEAASSVDRTQLYASEIFVREGGIYISSIDAARDRTVWAGPFKLVSAAGEPAAIVGFEGHFIKTFESGFIP